MKKLLLPVVLLVCSAFAFGQTVVDLTEDPSEFGLYDAINDATGPVEIILNPDVVYEIGSRSITYNTIIRTEGPTKAVIKITNNFWLSEGGVVLDSIVFENVHLKGGGYIFNNGNIYLVLVMASVGHPGCQRIGAGIGHQNIVIGTKRIGIFGPLVFDKAMVRRFNANGISPANVNFIATQGQIGYGHHREVEIVANGTTIVVNG